MGEPTKRKGLPTWVIVLIVLVVAAPVLLGIFSAVAIFGLRKYMQSAKRAEATHVLGAWSKGMVTCAEKDGLPLTSPAVPATLSSVSGMKYQSAASDWSDPAFVCAGFAMSEPQYFQYQWLQRSPSEGDMVALADLDADGNPEERFEVHIACTAGHCAASSLPTP